MILGIGFSLTAGCTLFASWEIAFPIGVKAKVMRNGDRSTRIRRRAFTATPSRAVRQLGPSLRDQIRFELISNQQQRCFSDA
jgi:hypothetical protein